MRKAIWIIVGILVVGAVIFAVVSRSNAPKAGATLTPEVIKRDAERFAEQADELTADVQQLQARLGSNVSGAVKQKLDELLAKANEMKAEAAKLKDMVGEEARPVKEKLADLNREARKLRRELEKSGK